MKTFPRPALAVAKTRLVVSDISAALHISEEDVIDKFSDARVTSWFAEIWGEQIFGYRKHSNANHPGSDGAISFGDLANLNIAVRCFRKNTLKFQKSKNIGSGRSATREDLIDALQSIDRYVVVDLRSIPDLAFYPLDTKQLLLMVQNGLLTTTGISPARFDTWILTTFEVTEYDIDLGGSI